MNEKIRSQLLEINRDFYEQFASSFSATRHQVQPGVRKLAQSMLNSNSILDVGCGNGTLSRELVKNNFTGNYLGIDMAESLLSHARQLMGEPLKGTYAYQFNDLADQNWISTLPHQVHDWLVCFATLHHIPGDENRQRIVKDFVKLISKQGSIAVSVWQWQNSLRLQKRVVPWSAVGLSQDDLEEGDVLLDWRAGNSPGLRYVHTFTDAELSNLAIKSGLRVIERFFSDGKNGNLALYQIWQMI